MTRYVVYSKNLSNGFEREIDKNTYDKLEESKNILSLVRSQENIYNIILMNYYEFEKELFEIMLNNEIFAQHDYENINEHRIKMEQRILNLLSSIILYLDTIKVNSENSFLQGEYNNIKNFFKDACDSDKKIEIMRFMRNHIQHNELLIKNIVHGSVNVSDDLRENTVTLSTNKTEIKARDFKVEKFTNVEEKIELKKYIRAYVDFISTVHNEFRKNTNDKVIQSRNNFEEFLKSYSKYKYLHIAKKENNLNVDEIAILLDWDDARVEMVKKNRVPTHFKRHSINTK